MAAKHKVTVSNQPARYQSTPAERRAAEIAALSTRQAELKQEATDRRAARADQSPPTGSTRRKAAGARRVNSR